jgi:hypothetical protein
VNCRYRKITISILILLLVLLISCKKKLEEAVILLTPFELVIADVHPSEVVSFTVDCQSPTEMKQFTVASRVEGSFTRTELDTLISGERFYMRFEYQVPDLIESAQIILEFTLSDIFGNIVTNAKIIEVVATAKYLKETAGHELFSGNSGKQNAYDLHDGVPLYMKLADSAIIHIADTSNSNVLLKRWVSPAGLKFVKFNGFDYANCTNLSVRNSYDAGIKTEFVDNITVGDIFLTRTNLTGTAEEYVAVKIVNIIDDTGSEWDRYIFNLKK